MSKTHREESLTVAGHSATFQIKVFNGFDFQTLMPVPQLICLSTIAETPSIHEHQSYWIPDLPQQVSGGSGMSFR